MTDFFPYRAYFATTDGRARKEHRQLERLGLNGTHIYRADDPVWQMFRPPWAFNCRCSFSPVTVEQAARQGVAEAREWLDRARELADENGGTFEQWLHDARPRDPEFVATPDFRPDPAFERGPSQFAEDEASPWVPYVGEQGGTGWRNTETGQVRYQKERPGSREERVAKRYSHDSVSTLLQQALADPSLRGRVRLGGVSSEQATMLGGIGVAVDGDFEHVIDAEHLRHSWNRSRSRAEATNLPLTVEDFEMLGAILESPDSVELVRPGRNGEQRIEYRKRVNGHYLIVTEVRRKQRELAVITISKKVASSRK